MKHLLVVVCPLNPRLRNENERNVSVFSELAERFRWYLIEHQIQGTPALIAQVGFGALHDTPFATEALVIMPTADVRLIRTKVPLISAKKLEALFPTIAEPYLIEQHTPLRYQLFPPSQGALGIERTIAITSDPWMTWLNNQLAQIPVQTQTLIPDCLLLSEPDASGAITEFLVDDQKELHSLAVREGDDWGSGWVESTFNQEALAELFPKARCITMNSTWLMNNALRWISKKSQINLIAHQSFKKTVTPSRYKLAIPRKTKIEWTKWRGTFRLASGFIVAYLAGSMLYFTTLGLSNWGWQNTLIEIVRRHLPSPVTDKDEAISSFIQQSAERIHAQGKNAPGDFVPMAGKLHILLSGYPAGLLESIHYQPSGLTFTLRNVQEAPPAASLTNRAVELEIALVQTGKNEYHMLPLAGLTANGAQ